MHLSHKIYFSQMMLDTSATTRRYLLRFSSSASVCEEVAKLEKNPKQHKY